MVTLRFFFLLISVLFAASLNAAPKDSIKIGAVLMLSGDQAVYGRALLEGIQIGLEEINSSGGINGRKIKLIVEDSELKPKVAHTAAKKLTELDKVTAVLNASFMESMANGKVFESARIPVITLWDSATEIEEIGDYVFGIGLWTPSSAKRASDYAFDDLKARSVVVVSLQSEWSETVADLFEKMFKEKGGKILKRFSLEPSETDFRTVIAKTKSLNPDVLYSPLTESVVAFYSQIRQANFNKPIVTSDIIADEHISLAPDIFEGIFQTSAQDPSSETAGRVLKLYRKKHNKDPKLPLFIAWGYDGFNLLVSSIKTVGEDPEGIKDYLYKVKDFPGASAKISFNKHGSSPVMEKMFKISNGKFELLDKE